MAVIRRSTKMAGMNHRFTSYLGLAVLAVAVTILSAGVTTSQAPAAPTFSKDVAPIFQEKCQACHRPDSIAPMSLVTFEQTRPWAKSIRERVISRNMTPWHIDKTVGIQHFANDRSLNDKEIDTIVRWIDAGAPQGDPRDMPKAKVWPDDSVWNFAQQFGGPPDLIVKTPLYAVSAGAVDFWYQAT